MQVKRLIRKRIRQVGSGIDLVADVNANVSVNVNDDRPSVKPTRTDPPASSRVDDGPDQRGREHQ